MNRNNFFYWNTLSPYFFYLYFIVPFVPVKKQEIERKKRNQNQVKNKKETLLFFAGTGDHTRRKSLRRSEMGALLFVTLIYNMFYLIGGNNERD